MPQICLLCVTFGVSFAYGWQERLRDHATRKYELVSVLSKSAVCRVLPRNFPSGFQLLASFLDAPSHLSFSHNRLVSGDQHVDPNLCGCRVLATCPTPLLFLLSILNLILSIPVQGRTDQAAAVAAAVSLAAAYADYAIILNPNQVLKRAPWL